MEKLLLSEYGSMNLIGLEKHHKDVTLYWIVSDPSVVEHISGLDLIRFQVSIP
jgi:hypothetical protein